MVLYPNTMSRSLFVPFKPSADFFLPLNLPTILSTFLVIVIASLAIHVSFRQARTLPPRGCRKLGLKSGSNLADEYDERYLAGGPPGTSKDGVAHWRVKSLWVYPIKSCRGVELERGATVATGMEHDRLFSFAQFRPPAMGVPMGASAERKWEFLTQRRLPLMAKVQTEIWIPDPSLPTYSSESDEVQSGGVIIAKFPFREAGWRGSLHRMTTLLGLTEPDISFRVPLNPTAEQIRRNGYTTDQMTIWKDAPLALNMTTHVPHQLAQFLGLQNPLGLFRVYSGHERQIFRCAPQKADLGWQPVTAFSDAVGQAIVFISLSIASQSNRIFTLTNKSTLFTCLT